MNRLQELRRKKEEEEAVTDDSDYSFDLFTTEANKKDIIETLIGPKYQTDLPEYNVYERPSRINLILPCWNPDEADDDFVEEYFAMMEEVLGEQICHEEKALKILKSQKMRIRPCLDLVKEDLEKYQTMLCKVQAFAKGKNKEKQDY